MPEDTGARPRSAFRVGRYEVDVCFANGGMATVHLGRLLGSAGFSRVVAIKRLLREFSSDPEFETMFVEEAELAARIRHPNVVPTLDVVSGEGELLLVMEYVHGESLGRLLARARTGAGVPLRVALTVICDTLQGLHAAHEAKDRQGVPLCLVHRDVSPQNVLVGVDGVARVIDFGIAKANTSLNTTREGLVRGKAAYMAPEQLCAEPVTRRTDLYSAGVMLWELLVGERLFPGGTRPDLVRKVEGHVPRPRERNPKISVALDGITMRALATAPDDRYPDALTMAQAIERTGLLAARSEVAAWVERLAKDELAHKAELLANVESQARSVPPPAPPAEPSLISSTDIAAQISIPTPATPSARKRPALFVAGGLLLGAGLVLGLTLGRSGESDRAVAAALPVAVERPESPNGNVARSDVTPPAAPARSAPLPSALVAPATTEKALGPVPASSAEAKQAEGVAARSGAGKPSAKAKTKARNCDPPYTTDAKGRRRYKAECF